MTMNVSDGEPGLRRPTREQACDRIPGTRFRLDGWIGGYLDAVGERWLKVAPSRNPAMLEMFADRDREPLRELLPWSGEFAGKYLTSAVQVYRVTRDESLRRVIDEFATRLIALQAEDGYLGAWPKGSRLTGHAPNVRFHYPSMDLTPPNDRTWDAWSHHHVMMGLLMWFEETGEESFLSSARRIGDLLCDVFEKRPLVDIPARIAATDPKAQELRPWRTCCALSPDGSFEFEPAVFCSTEMNQAVIHSLCRLYEHTGDERYLRQALKIRDEFATVAEDGTLLAGNYLEGPLSGKDFFELPHVHWESLHAVMGLADLAAIAGDERSRTAVDAIWWSIVKTDRHNTGAFSSDETVVGNPYVESGIETCCVVAWVELSVEMLRLTGDSIVADELEFTTLNAVVGYHEANGRWVTYDTPMDGVRRPSMPDLSFQAREGSPDMNCCSAHGARGFGAISEWALMADDDGLMLNWYGPGSMTAPWRGGEVTLTQETEYPRDDTVRLNIEVDEPRSFVLRLRIPHWATTTDVRVNGEPVPNVVPGQYLALERMWSSGDRIDITFDFALQYWVGERECEGKVSIYRGPILLTYDPRFDTLDSDELPALDARGLEGEVVDLDGELSPMLLMEFQAPDGRTLRLCDFGSAGSEGSPYRSWLKVDSCQKTDFSRDNPRRTAPVP
jgi:DUF1680 family protein